MIIELNAYDMQNKFQEYGRDNYSYEGYDALLDYYNSIDRNMKLDVIAICTEWDEFSDEAELNFDDLVDSYGDYYTYDEWIENNAEEFRNLELDYDDYIEDLCSVLEQHTTVYSLPNGGYLIQKF